MFIRMAQVAALMLNSFFAILIGHHVRFAGLKLIFGV